MKNPWEDLAPWWLDEAASDRAYETDLVPLLLELLPPLEGASILDIGCGEGRVMRLIGLRGAKAIGLDLNRSLARVALEYGPVLVGRLPGLDCLRAGSFDAAVAVLVLEHVDDLEVLFAEVARVIRAEGSLIVLMNHPLYTAPESAPIVDSEDGELFWRWGSYLSAGPVVERIGNEAITFYHRPLAEILNAAAGSGWSLERMEERAIEGEALEQLPALAAQTQVPRLLGARWRRI